MNIIQLLDKSIPRYIVLLIDLFICLTSLYIAYILRFNFSIPENVYGTFHQVFPLVIGVRLVSFLYFRTYTSIVRYTSTRDASRIIITLIIGSLTFAAFNLLLFSNLDRYIVPFSVLIIEFLITIFIMVSGRLLIKVGYIELTNPSRHKSEVIIYGAGEAGLITKRTLDRDKGTKYKVLAFVDDDVKKAGKKLEGIQIYHSSQLNLLQENHEVKQLIIAIQNISSLRKQQIIDSCLKYKTRILNVPPVKSWINGALSFKQIRTVDIEDLLGRSPISLDMGAIQKDISGSTILITGAAGSIGSEIARQVIGFKPALLVLLDCAESPLYQLELEISDHFGELKVPVEIVIADIRNQERMSNVFATFSPDIVYHAAAYKHVPVMENNPSEAILNNVLGTKTIADLSLKHGVKKFVMISTDKAVNPTNIMGATKRIAEIYCQSLNTVSTQFVTTRFGNVLGSNGSVIPRFRKQIESGQPITVTDPEVTRFFMTIPEACQLVLEAGAMSKGGEIFIFDMGESIKIADLAKKMIRLSGLELGKDIQIIYTGLRPGEKLYEELLANEENTLPTHHPKIMIAKVKLYDFNDINKSIIELIDLFKTQNNQSIVKKMKEIVPEFISKNSVYEKLDQ